MKITLQQALADTTLEITDEDSDAGQIELYIWDKEQKDGPECIRVSVNELLIAIAAFKERQNMEEAEIIGNGSGTV